MTLCTMDERGEDRVAEVKPKVAALTTLAEKQTIKEKRCDLKSSILLLFSSKK